VILENTSEVTVRIKAGLSSNAWSFSAFSKNLSFTASTTLLTERSPSLIAAAVPVTPPPPLNLLRRHLNLLHHHLNLLRRHLNLLRRHLIPLHHHLNLLRRHLNLLHHHLNLLLHHLLRHRHRGCNKSCLR
jgi:hypothetical protein